MKGKFLRTKYTIILWLILICGAVNAAPLLNEQNISQFARTWGPITQRLMSADPEFDPLNVPGLTGQLELMVANDGPASARDKSVQGYGYADFESWAKTAGVIIREAQWASNTPDERDLEAVIQAINADTQRSAADKASAIADLKSALDTSLKLKPDTDDIALVAKFLPLLKPILDPQ